MLTEVPSDFGGELIRPGDEGYDEARRVWNWMIDRRPELIARCHTVADVIATVELARESRLPLAVRGGGHSVAGTGVCDGGILLDLSFLKGIRVDPASRTARAQGGVKWGELDRETQTFGLATNGGVVSTTGIGGLTLGGGIGWLARKYGTSCDNLISADVVTADGHVAVANASENADLFWGLRGGGGNFGVVTSFEYRLHPVGPHVLAGVVFHPGEQTAGVLRFFRDYVAAAPDELTVMAVGMTAAPAPFLPVEAHGQPVVALAACYAGDLAKGEEVLGPLRAYGRPLADVIGPMPYTAVQRMFDESFPPGRHNYWKSSYFNELTDGAIDVVADHVDQLSSPLTSFYFEHLGGAISRLGREDTAFGHRDATFDFSVLSAWTDPDESERHIAWSRGFWEALQPHAAEGVYVNNLGSEGEERVRTAYSPERYERLVALKGKYDPDNLFSLNQNIKPARAREAAPA